MKHLLKTYPELILLALTAIAWIGEKSFNPVLVILTSMLLLVLIARNRYVAIFVGLILIMLSGFMLLAVFSEFSEYKAINLSAILLLGVGVCLFSLTGLLSWSIMNKYLPKTDSITSKL